MPSKFEDDLLHSYSETELDKLICESPRLAPRSSVFVLSANLLAKYNEPEEVEDTAKALNVARQLGIRVPNINRVIKLESCAYFSMERIKGNTLEDAWARLNWWTTIRLALQLHRFVKRLRSVTSPTAGSLVTGECKSFWLEDSYGTPARSSPEAIKSFLQIWADFDLLPKAMKAAAEGLGHPKRSIPPTPKMFFLTHHDWRRGTFFWTLLVSFGCWIGIILDFTRPTLSTQPCRTSTRLETGTCSHDYDGIFSPGLRLVVLSELPSSYGGSDLNSNDFPKGVVLSS